MRRRQGISALLDGELHGVEMERAMADLAQPDGQSAWRSYRLTGEVLRDGSVEFSPGYAARLAARLDAEAPPGAQPGWARPARPRRPRAPAAANGDAAAASANPDKTAAATPTGAATLADPPAGLPSTGPENTVADAAPPTTAPHLVP